MYLLSLPIVAIVGNNSQIVINNAELVAIEHLIQFGFRTPSYFHLEDRLANNHNILQSYLLLFSIIFQHALFLNRKQIQCRIYLPRCDIKLLFIVIVFSLKNNLRTYIRWLIV